jgi:hypothetical protein
MGSFLEIAKVQQATFRANSSYFSAAAKGNGIYKGYERGFCLPVELAEENLFPGIRKAARAYFGGQAIQWHDGRRGNPSNHLCSSQVCCVNFLFPFADQPDALATVLRPIFPEIREMLPIEAGYVEFEWIGLENYLHERVPLGGQRTRGANCTSADAAVLFQRKDGKRQFALIEWKYTESYSGAPLKVAKSGTDRTLIYEGLFRREDCPLHKNLLPSFESLFYEPFYQFMRQQFLAHEMELAREKGADIVSVLHIAPACNTDFGRVTSPEMEALGDTALGIWKRLVRPCDRFVSVGTEELFGHLSADDLPGMAEWLDYVGCRYPWVQADGVVK